ncbi:MAG: exodeoxyribonuclease V subunit alpha [Balneolaceae bacterium]|nr:exodeoxyribonuclease V subunit alpha [Balneolaceae bacterium]
MNKALERISKLVEEGELDDIDLEFCRFLCRTLSDVHPAVLWAAAMVSYAYRQGDVCLPLGNGEVPKPLKAFESFIPDRESWIARLHESDAVGKQGDFKPLILDESHRLYLHRLWIYEQQLARQILSRSSKIQEKVTGIDLVAGKVSITEEIERNFGDLNTEAKWQAVAALSCLLHDFTVISGGPGTGKTTTVVKILALLQRNAEVRGGSLSIALAAPTGKAASRLESSVNRMKTEMSIEESLASLIPAKAKTVHQLLGASRHSSRFRYNEDNPMPYDLVVIDEASMIDQALMSRLMAAMLPDSKLILLGDKDQLASVEAGSVLGDICNINVNRISTPFAEFLKNFNISVEPEKQATEGKPLTDQVILLEKNYRFDAQSGISELSVHINRGKADKAIELMEDPNYEGVSFYPLISGSDMENVLSRIVEEHVGLSYDITDPESLFERFSRFQLLSAHRRGPLGTVYLNDVIEKLVKKKFSLSKYDSWYHGKPVMVTRNEYTMGLNNGDIGICVLDRDEKTRKVLFRDGDGFKAIPVERLPDHELAYALTVHKSQGSEFEEIFLIHPHKESPILTRELIYTAITRAQKKVTIAGRKEILTYGIREKMQRTSGLKDLLWD